MKEKTILGFTKWLNEIKEKEMKDMDKKTLKEIYKKANEIQLLIDEDLE